MKKIENMNPILFSIIVAFITIGGLHIIGLALGALLGLFFVVETDYYFFFFICELAAAIFVFCLTWRTKHTYTLKRKGAGIPRSIAIGAYPIVLFLLLGFMLFFSEFLLGGELLSPLHIIAYVGSMFLIGFVEELAFRGIIAETLINHYGASTSGAWKATIVSGFIFGIAHMSNILEAPLLGVCVQVAVASVLGMLLSAIYYRSGNLWICIFIHGGLDCASLIQSGVFGDGTVNDMVSSLTLVNLVPCITYFIPVLILLRHSKNHEVESWFGNS